MRILALDTTTRAGSAAIVEDDAIVAERCGDPGMTIAERLPRELLDLLAAHGWTTASVDLFAVAAGPGSFTGLRVGIATIQGLAFVHKRRVAAVSALEAIGQATAAGLAAGSLAGVWMDAQRRDVFSALYRVAPVPAFDPQRLIEVAAPAVAAPDATLERWTDADPGSPAVVAGDGAVAFAPLLASRYPGAAIAPHPCLAGAIGRIAFVHAAAGLTLDPAGVRPLYIRRPDAEVERERRQQAAG
jgi:tRNA threonylcarbamoyladenosine biosynthesis protein TsaB